MDNIFATLKDFVWAIWGRVGEGHFGLIAAGVAFYAMFAVFPGLAASVAIWSLVADPAVIAEYLAVGERFLPAEAATLIHDQVMGLLSTPRATLGWATFASVAVALYSARAGVAAVIGGLDVVHRTQPRGFLWGWAVDFLMTVSMLLAVFVALATVVVLPIALTYLPSAAAEAWLLKVLPWVSVGVVVAALTWSGVSFAFSAYLANFDSYNRVYGSIGAVIALMMWLYLSVWAILVGGAINAELDARARKEQAKGPV